MSPKPVRIQSYPQWPARTDVGVLIRAGCERRCEATTVIRLVSFATAPLMRRDSEMLPPSWLLCAAVSIGSRTDNAAALAFAASVASKLTPANNIGCGGQGRLYSVPIRRLGGWECNILRFPHLMLMFRFVQRINGDPPTS